MFLEKLHARIRDVHFFIVAKVDVLTFGDPNQNLKELKSNDRIIIVIVLVSLLKVSRLEIGVHYSTVHCLVNNACFLAKVKKLFFLNVRRITASDCDTCKYFLKFGVPQAQKIHHRSVCLERFANLFDLPVFGIMSIARIERFLGIFFPVFKDGVFLDEYVLISSDMELFRESGDTLIANFRKVAFIVPSEGAIFLCLVRLIIQMRSFVDRILHL